VLPAGVLALAFLALSASAWPAHGQFRGQGPLVLELPSATRVAALGNTFFPGGADPSAIFYQPGGLGAATGMTASAMRYGPAGRLAVLAAGTAWLNGGVALGAQHLSYGAPAAGSPDVQDLLALSADEGSLRQGGDVGIAEMVVSAGYGRTLKGVRVGAVGKLIEQRFGSLRGSTAAADLGAAFNAGPLSVGLAVQNLGPHLGIGGGEVPLPRRFALAGSTRSLPVGPLDVAVGAGLLYRSDGELVPSLGMEVGYWPISGRTFVGRIGLRRPPDASSAGELSFGGAFWGDRISLDYAYQPFHAGAGVHSFGVGWR
jgi:hypothetical protein